MPAIATNDAITVLVVDDDALTLMAAVMTVESAGYAVVSAANAAGAMQALRQHAQIAALFTDIQMPGLMNGLALAREAHLQWPALHILLTSGDTSPTPADMPRDGQFLRKPYTPNQVLGVLGAMLA